MKKRYLFTAFLIIHNFFAWSQYNSFNSSTIQVELSEINSAKSEFGPAIIEDALYFSKSDETKKTSKGKKTFYNLYSVPMNESGKINKTAIPEKSSISEYHEGPLVFCEKTGELFVTQSNLNDPEVSNTFIKQKTVKLGIVVYKRSGNTWTFDYAFPHNSSEYGIAHPAINTAGDTLLFASDMSDGFGNTDLYMSIREKGQWGKPVNLGKNINTKGSEMTPFFSKDGYMIFASDGLPGEGKLDLFFTQLPLNREKKSINFGQTINSTNDDFGLVLHPNHQYGYFSSDRNGGIGSDDIYSIKFTGTNVDFKTFSSDSQKKLPFVNLKITDRAGSVFLNDSSDAEGQLSAILNYDQNYSVHASKEQYVDTLLDIQYSDINIFRKAVQPVSLDPISKIIEQENKKEVEKVEAVIREDLNKYVLEMQSQKFISDNVVCNVDVALVSNNENPAIKVSYSYDLINDTLKFQLDDFGLGKYKIKESNAVQVALSVMKKSIEGELNKYLNGEKNITITISGSADAIPIRNAVNYNGEYGDNVVENCKVKGKITPMSVSKKEGIKTNNELAFIRSYAVRHYIEHEIDELDNTEKEYFHEAFVSEEKGGKFRRINIEMIIHNAFKNMQQY